MTSNKPDAFYNIQGWIDQSGNGHNLHQNDPDKRPVLQVFEKTLTQEEINKVGKYLIGKWLIPAPLWKRIIYKLTKGKYGKLYCEWVDL